MLNWNIQGEYKTGEDVVFTILKNRGILNKDDFLKDRSIKEGLNELGADFLQSLKDASKIINSSISEQKHILIFGDYDSDGVNSTAILFNYLSKERSYNKVSYFIPNRFDHSYGLSMGAINDALANYSNEKVLIVTVDLGITAVEEVKKLKEMGHDVIITDHHQQPQTIPSADCIVWSDKVCGAVISWFLSRFLGSCDQTSVAYAALATVTDLQTLTGINRIIVKKGLEVLNTNPPLGLKKLLDTSGKTEGEITTYDLGWVLGPRLNASGRLETAEDSIKLLVEADEKEAEKYASNLNSKNIQRQEKTIEMYDIASGFDKDNLPKVIISSDEKYHEGVIGLVAAKLVQTYYRPSIVMCLIDDYAKGSVRSIPGVNIVEMLREFSNLFIDLGGHPMAAGFTIEKKNIEEFKDRFTKYAQEKIDDSLLTPTVNVDLKIPAILATANLCDEIESLRPFGIGNELPVFASFDLGVVNTSVVGKDSSHLKMDLYDGEKYHKAIYFGGAKYKGEINTGDRIDLVYTLKKNGYNGNNYVDLVVKDFRKAK